MSKVLVDLFEKELAGTKILSAREQSELLKQLALWERDNNAYAYGSPPLGGGTPNLNSIYLRLNTSNDPLIGALEIRTSTIPQHTLTGGSGTDVVQRFQQDSVGGTMAFSGATLAFTTATPNDWVVAGGGTIQTTAEYKSDTKWAAGVTLSDTTPTAYFYAAIPTGSYMPTGAVIRSISVTVTKRNEVEPVFRPILDAGVYMFLSGVAQGADHSSASVWPATFQDVTYTWTSGTLGSITGASVNNGNVKFGIRCARDVVSALDGLANIDYISISITYGASWEIGIDASAGKLALGVEGWAASTTVYVGEDGQITIPVATGTSPLSVSSTTVNTNFNADLLDGYHAADLPYVDISGTPAANQLAYWTDADTIAGDALITRFSDATNRQLIIGGADTVYKGLVWRDTTSSEEWVLSHRVGSVSNNFELYYSPNGSSYTRAWYWDISGNALSPFTVGAKLESAAGIRLDPNAATGNFTLSLSPANLTAARRVTFPNADLTITGGGTLALGGFTLTVPATGTTALLDYANAPATGFGLGIAPTANTYFHVSYANNSTSGTLSAAKILMLHTPASASSAAAVGLYIYAEGTGNQNIPQVSGLFGQAVYSGSVTVATIYGLAYGVDVSVGTATIASGIDIYVNKSSGTIGTATGINIQNITSGTTNYAIKTGLGIAQFGDTTRIIDKTSAALGVGGKLEFHGAYTGTSTTTAAKINAAKTTATGGEWGFDLVFLTRLNGSGSTTEHARLISNGGFTLTPQADAVQLIVTGFTTQAVATPITQFIRNDAAAGISAMLGLTALGSGANGDGGSVLYNGKSSTTAAQAMGSDQWLWVNATHASRTARRVFNVYDTAVREALRIEASGTAAMIGFFGVTSVVRPTALTTALTTVTCTVPGTPDYAIQDLAAGGYGFVTADEAQSTIKVIANLQTRVGELETKLQSLGLIS
jgi:hypothetical protein